MKSSPNDNIAAGMTPERGAKAGGAEFGGREQIKKKYATSTVSDSRRIVANLKSASASFEISTFSRTVILTLRWVSAPTALSSPPSTPSSSSSPFPEADQLMRVDQYNPKTSSPLHAGLPRSRLEDWNNLIHLPRRSTGYLQRRCSESTGLCRKG